MTLCMLLQKMNEQTMYVAISLKQIVAPDSFAVAAPDEQLVLWRLKVSSINSQKVTVIDPGHLSCGKRRYGHPALTGVLPKPWLPLKKGQSLVNRGPHRARKDAGDNALVLTLRRRQSASKRRSQVTFERPQPQLELSMNPWNESTPLLNAASGDPAAKTSRTLSHRMSFDVASGVMALPEEDDWIENGADSDSEDYGLSEAPSPGPGSNGVSEQEAAGPEADADSSTMTPRKRLAIYFHHPEKRVSRPGMPGEFPR
jgi:hypothetical protein